MFSGGFKSLPGGSAPGRSGCRANHFKAVLYPSPDRAASALRAMTEVVKLLCAGDTPAEVVSYLCGVILLACQKKGGGLHPIVVGEVLHCLSSKCLSRAVQSDAFRSLTPLQIGMGVKAGCEAIVHFVTCTLETLTYNLRNAGHFSLFLKCLQQHLPRQNVRGSQGPHPICMIF